MNASSINQQALLKAGGIGLAVTILMTLVNQGVSFLATSATGDAAAVLLSVSGFLGLCTCCLGILAYAGVGAGYAFFAGQTGTPVEPGPMALGGAVTAVAVGFVNGLCGGILGAITGVSQMSALQDLGGSDPVAGAAGLAGGVLGVLLVLCVAVVVSAVLGAAGGAIYAAVQGNKSTPAAPPPAM